MTFYKIKFGKQTPRIFVFPSHSQMGVSFFKEGRHGSLLWYKENMRCGFAKRITRAQAKRFMGKNWGVVEDFICKGLPIGDYLESAINTLRT